LERVYPLFNYVLLAYVAYVISRLFYACAFIAIAGIDLSQYRRIFNNRCMPMMHLAAICSQWRFSSGISAIPTQRSMPSM